MGLDCFLLVYHPDNIVSVHDLGRYYQFDFESRCAPQIPMPCPQLAEYVQKLCGSGEAFAKQDPYGAYHRGRALAVLECFPDCSAIIASEESTPYFNVTMYLPDCDYDRPAWIRVPDANARESGARPEILRASNLHVYAAADE